MCVRVCVCVCVCMCVNYKRWGECFRSFASIRHRNAITFDTRKTLHLTKPPAKLLKTYLKDNGNICFVVI